MSKSLHNPMRAITIGASIAIISASLIASPLLLGHDGPMKYIVAFGIAGACLGISMFLHGLWDQWFRKP